MEIKVRSYFRKKLGIKLKATNVAEMVVIYASNDFETDEDSFLDSIEKQIADYE